MGGPLFLNIVSVSRMATTDERHLMKPKSEARNRFVRICRSTHSWLGIFVFPWVIMMGFTGFYMNHEKLVLLFVQPKGFSERGFDRVQPPVPITSGTAYTLGKKIWPQQPIEKISVKPYHGRPSYYIRKNNGLIVLSIPTGHYYIKTRYTRQTFSPDGDLLHTKRYWGRIFKDLHEKGWLGGSLGTVLADAVSIVLMVFGATGSMMWLIPRFRRFLARA